MKSNLERLYRNTDGEIVWMNRDGEVVSLPEVKKNFPLLIESFAPVQKIFTQVTHKKDSQTAGSVNNNVWDSAVTANDRLYEYGKDGQIADSKEVNQGYTRLLETQQIHPLSRLRGSVRVFLEAAAEKQKIRCIITMRRYRIRAVRQKQP